MIFVEHPSGRTSALTAAGKECGKQTFEDVGIYTGNCQLSQPKIAALVQAHPKEPPKKVATRCPTTVPICVVKLAKVYDCEALHAGDAVPGGLGLPAIHIQRSEQTLLPSEFLGEVNGPRLLAINPRIGLF